MIDTLLKPLFNHFKARAGAIIRNPAALTVLVLFGAAGMVYWPGATVIEGGNVNPLDRLEEGPPLRLLWLLWFYLWPMLPMVYARGRAAGKGRSNPLAVLSAPALPVGLGQRALAEAVLALGIMSIVRIAGMAWFQGTEPAPLVSATVGGAIFLLPIALAWAIPAANLNVLMWRPLVVAVIATVLHSAGGFFATWSAMIVTGLILSALVLGSARLETPGWRWKPAARPAESRARPALASQTQLNRDAWRLITRIWGPWLVLATVVFVIGLVLDLRGLGWDWAFFGGFEVFLIIGLQPLFRPLGLNVVAESLVGKHGAERGDFMRSWSVLPVVREAVLRRVWLHGMVVGVILWTVPVTLLAIRSRIRLGAWGLNAADGHSLAEFVILGAAIVPMMAGLLVAAALGRRLETALSGLITLVGVYTLLPVKVLLVEAFGPDSTAAVVGLALYFAVLVAAASIPPLRFLCRVQRIEAIH